MAGRDQDAQPSETTEAHERASLLAAFRRTAGEQGYRTLTIEAVARAAGLPRERFDAHFAGKEEALLAAQTEFLDRLGEQMRRACKSGGEWPDRLGAAITSLLDGLAEAEGLARALALEAPAASFGAAQSQFEALDEFAVLLREGRRHCPGSDSLPELTETVLIGGLASIITERLLVEDAAALRPLQPQLLEILLIPYLGAEDARRAAAGL